MSSMYYTETGYNFWLSRSIINSLRDDSHTGGKCDTRWYPFSTTMTWPKDFVQGIILNGILSTLFPSNLISLHFLPRVGRGEGGGGKSKGGNSGILYWNRLVDFIRFFMIITQALHFKDTDLHPQIYLNGIHLIVIRF